MKAEILSIGTELLLGQIVDTNANYLAQQLPALGLDLYYVSQIGDNLQRLADALRRRRSSARTSIITHRRPRADRGRSDPRSDRRRHGRTDCKCSPSSKRSCARSSPAAGARCPSATSNRRRTIPSGTYLPNPIGTAPGLVGRARRQSHHFDARRAARDAQDVGGASASRGWRELLSGGVIVSRTLKLAGIGESHAEEALGDLTRSTNPTLATYAKSDGIHLRLTAKAATRSEADAAAGRLRAAGPRACGGMGLRRRSGQLSGRGRQPVARARADVWPLPRAPPADSSPV